MIVIPDMVVNKLAEAGFAEAERFAEILTGDISADLDEKIRYELQLHWCTISLDTITTALITHNGVNPAVMAYAASIMSLVIVQTPDIRPLIMMGPLGRTKVVLSHDPYICWYSDTVIAGSMDQRPDMEGSADDGILAVPHMPDSMISLMPGRPLRDILSHPALDPLELVVLDASGGEHSSHIRIKGHTKVKGRDLTALLPKPPARRDVWGLLQS